MKRYISLSIIAISLICGCAKDIEPNNGNTLESGLERITISLVDGTKTAYSYEDQQLKAYWSAGDIVSITPDLWKYHRAGEYEVETPGSSTATFKQKTAIGGESEDNIYGIFYPGTKIKSTAQFTKFEYSGQIQKKSDPMGHLGAYHSMRTSASDYSTISFAGADQSSCMKFNLSGMTFVNPVKVEMTIVGKGSLYINNTVSESFSYSKYYDKPQDLTKTSRLSVELEEYNDESNIEAWMMMSNAPVTLYSGDTLRVYVYCENGVRYYSDIPVSETTVLAGGYCHNLTIQTGWKVGSGDFSKYDWDGEVVTLQEGKGKLDLVLMGDGFIKEDFENGTYESIMKQAFNEFFSIEPFATLKSGFNVYYVKAPSPERIQATNTGSNGAVNTGHITKFSTTFTANSTSIGGDDDLVREYALKAFSSDAEERIKDATIVVIANQECRAGSCLNSWYSSNGQDYGQASAIAYCALGTSNDERVEIMHHEICGHGFGKLADEYYYTTVSSFSSSLLSNQDKYHKDGLFRNVDKYIDQNLYDQLDGQYPLTDTTNVYWHDLFGTANNYESENVESLGIFKGGNTYSFGFCRPTEDGDKSIMNNNTGIFNAISRRAIYYRYRRLSGEVTSNIWGTAEELEAFLKWDAEEILPKLNLPLKSNATVPASISTRKPLAPPILKSGYWENCKFYENEPSSPNEISSTSRFTPSGPGR